MRQLYQRHYPFYAGRLGAALLLIRAVMGLAFIFHGLGKVKDPGDFAKVLSIPVPLATFAAWVELGGGALLLVGLLTPVAAFFLAAQMVAALGMVHLPHHDPFVDPKGSSFELPAVYLCAALGFLLAGPGAYSIDALLFGSHAPADTGVMERQRGAVM